MKVARILSIDGGGIRGIIPGTIIAYLEKLAGPSSKLFHMISGTSTGGIIACGLNEPLSAKEMVEFYKKEGPSIFSSTLGTVGGLTGEIYTAEVLEKVLKTLLKKKFSESVTDLMVTSYDIEKRKAHLIKSWEARGIDTNTPDDYYSRDAARATSAAPTYFMPARIRSVSGKYYPLIDGGVFANNPAMCAYVAARRLYPLAEQYLIVSIGTGETKKPIKYEDAKDFGLIGWARPLLDIMFDGVSSTTDYELTQLLPQVKHFRLQATSLQNDSMDDVSPENLAALVKAGEAAVKANSKNIGEIITMIKQPMTDRKLLGYPPIGKPVKEVSETVGKGTPIKSQSVAPTLGAAGIGAIAGSFLGPLGALAGAAIGTALTSK